MSYAVKYELARSLAAQGEKSQAGALFRQLYQETLDAGLLPPIDQDFKAAAEATQDPFGSDDLDGDSFGTLMRAACSQMIQRKQRPLAIGLAWQCRQLGDTSLADNLIDDVLAGVSPAEAVITSLAIVDYLATTGKHDRAESLLQVLLAEPQYSTSPTLWRWSARIASQGGRMARSITYLERATDLEYQSLPDNYNIEQVRANYLQLFTRYRELARIVANPGSGASLDLATRVIESADRWRSLDTDVTAACQNAANVLNELGEEDLAWDYLTTPLALKPNEAGALLELAVTLGNDERYALAERAYERAYEAESTNAQILWDHAQLLERAGKGKKALELYRRIAEGQWQPRFQQLKWQAEQIKSRNE